MTVSVNPVKINPLSSEEKAYGKRSASGAARITPWALKNERISKKITFLISKTVAEFLFLHNVSFLTQRECYA